MNQGRMQAGGVNGWVLSGIWPALLLAALVAGSGAVRDASAQGGASPDAADAIARIRDEGLNRSQVMPTVSYLSDVIGPRLTGSPQMRRANEWTRDRLSAWGLANARLEAWGKFGRGWSLERFSAQVIEPQAIPLIAYPKAWSPGTRGAVTGDVVYLEARDEAGLQAYRGRLKGAIVLVSPPRPIAVSFDPQARRRTDAELQELARATGGPSARRAGPGGGPSEQRTRSEFTGKRLTFLMREGAAAQVEVSALGDGGAVFVQSASVPQPPASGTPPDPAAAGGGRPRTIAAWDPEAPKTLPQVVVAVEQYNRLVRMIQQGEKLRMAVDLKVRFHDEDLTGYNTLAEIPGTDLRREVVMLGGHMDSWHTGTGATDNATGVAVCMEAVRILKALRLQPRRTVRIALWTGEEQGLLGSRGYVAEHFREPAAPGAPAGSAGATKPEYEALSAYYNLDVGTGKIRGIYIGRNEALRPLFAEWLAPFKELGAETISATDQRGTDHNSFTAVGLPGFQFIQDPIEYFNRTHHSNLDVYDRVQVEDLKQAAVIMAAFVYRTAMRDERLPRVTGESR